MKFQTQGLIVREKAVGERGWFLTILTDEHGMLQAFVNRGKSQKERLPGTGLLSYSRLDIYKGRDKYIVGRAVSLRGFTGLRRDLEGMALAMYLCQLAGELIMVGEEHTQEALRLMLNALYFLDEGKRPGRQIKAIVELRLLADSGYLPDLTGCAGCGAEEGEAMYFRLGEGTLVCENCRERDGQPTAVLGRDALRAMRHIVYGEFEKIFSFTLPERGMEELSAAAEAYMLYILQEKPKTLELYHSIL